MKIYTSTKSEPSFSDFAGQPIWVKVYDREWKVYWYIQIVSVGPEWLRYKFIPDYFADDKMDYATDLLHGIETKVHYGNIKDFKIATPLQLISDEDLEDLINA